LEDLSHPVGRNVAPSWKLSLGKPICINDLRKTKVLKDCFKETLFIVLSDNNIMPRSTAKNLHGNLTLIPVVPVVAVDLIRFEKNLLQMGFFGAHDTRHSVQSSRRIEQLVTRNGQRIKVAAEFRGSHELGLPSTSDRDKYIAFTKIAMEQKLNNGRIENPVRFTGYRLLRELGLTLSGENYEDINRWGQRMADTTITSEQVIYMAARKKYANKTVHVFRSFQRTGQSDNDGSGRSESFEVVLEDWLLENLNESFVVPEDFTAYRSLRRPTAKGIFGYLHLWFHASHGRAVEKDYAELCMLLNIPAYQHASKIRETMGRSLNELRDVGYLSEWDLKPMTTRDGYKLVLFPGEQLARVLALSLRKQVDAALPPSGASDGECQEPVLSNVSDKLQARGITRTKAVELAEKFSAEAILDQIEYAEHVLAHDRRGKLDNPAGFIIYAIEQQLPIPPTFVTSRQMNESLADTAKDVTEAAKLEHAHSQYHDFLERKVDLEIETQYPGIKLQQQLDRIIKSLRADARFKNMLPDHRAAYAEQLLRNELRSTLPLPSFDLWSESAEQFGLF